MDFKKDGTRLSDYRVEMQLTTLDIGTERFQGSSANFNTELDKLRRRDETNTDLQNLCKILSDLFRWQVIDSCSINRTDLALQLRTAWPSGEQLTPDQALLRFTGSLISSVEDHFGEKFTAGELGLPNGPRTSSHQSISLSAIKLPKPKLAKLAGLVRKAFDEIFD
ncbi:MAG TPA: hypothetical protein VD907_00150 [Verrucomicrobiae bacterium]|nr:hypothetical protein [Verrucomicrobiae bacterium]